MSKIKLPRKRKKYYIKKNGANNYKLHILSIEVCNDFNPSKATNRFIKKMDRRCKIISIY